ncbi:unnamed protein product [Schistosoma mattheei]|uniref:Uncharacterized protein n=1 Tax=Schistosoma mattheei TaxID=31246 RepID=A0A3P8HIA1_9TREM|nr:unnamed protein product [Schistosoma mattheei]
MVGKKTCPNVCESSYHCSRNLPSESPDVLQMRDPWTHEKGDWYQVLTYEGRDYYRQMSYETKHRNVLQVL